MLVFVQAGQNRSKVLHKGSATLFFFLMSDLSLIVFSTQIILLQSVAECVSIYLDFMSDALIKSGYIE